MLSYYRFKANGKITAQLQRNLMNMASLAALLQQLNLGKIKR
jgi:hypothetical protein